MNWQEVSGNFLKQSELIKGNALGERVVKWMYIPEDEW